ncbi:MAG: Crp/Fnr family transcriptional regulator [Gammaproteobacteria bacterium]
MQEQLQSAPLNELLARLPLEDYTRLASRLQQVKLERGQILAHAGQQLGYLYFPFDAIVTKLHLTADGDTAAIGMIGREGVVGMSSFMDGGEIVAETLVIKAGAALRLERQAFRREFERSGSFQKTLLRFLEAYIVQTGQIAVCYRHHTVEQQFCSWLLLYLERAAGGELRLTHELIAGLLGVRREAVTRAAFKLKQDGIFDYRRGWITIHNTARLRALARECYMVIHKAYQKLLKPLPEIAGNEQAETLPVNKAG